MENYMEIVFWVTVMEDEIDYKLEPTSRQWLIEKLKSNVPTSLSVGFDTKSDISFYYGADFLERQMPIYFTKLTSEQLFSSHGVAKIVFKNPITQKILYEIEPK
jgi:hypothetical protein